MKMKLKFKWDAVAELLKSTVNEQKAIEAEERETPLKDGKSRVRLNRGQRASLLALAERLPKNGVLVADEVGMGKTRIAVEVARCVTECGGRVAILIPPGLGYQWRSELQDGGLDCEPILRSLKGYFDAWSGKNVTNQKPWFDEDVVLVSHQFCNWRLGKNDQRWALLPETYVNARNAERLHRVRCVPPNVGSAAKSIYEAVLRRYGNPARQTLNDILEKVQWPAARNKKRYSSNEVGDPRNLFERVVGVGLGVFDLLIIDEAHKNRGQDGMLTRLLEMIVRAADSSRTLGLTATPVELEADDLEQIFKRLGVDDGKGGANISKVIKKYSSAVKNLQRGWQTNPEARATFEDAASRFKATLSDFLLRRDKREEPLVKEFAERTKSTLDGYRRETLIRINPFDPIEVSDNWRRVICATESLSAIKDRSQSSVSKRLRLTLGSGYGIANILDSFHRDKEDDKKQQAFDDEIHRESNAESHFSVDVNDHNSDAKGAARAKWWTNVVKRIATAGENSLFEYPTIQRAVKEIKEILAEHADGRKVLVFGKFTKPMRALVNLLNAHEMLRCLDNGIPWPQSKVHKGSGGKSDDSEWAAIQAVQAQSDRQESLENLNSQLELQYEKEQRRREKFSGGLMAKLDDGIGDSSISKAVRAVYQSFKAEFDLKSKAKDNPLPVVVRAIADSLGLEYDDRSNRECAIAFSDLVTAACDNDDLDKIGKNIDDEVEREDVNEAAKPDGTVWGNSKLFERLTAEYNHLRGGFARLMIGPTRNESRRIIQQAFNRPHSYPRVLVAQSLVGREGLNLHKSCRVVILLHMEWNAGVVEQQIGRVDRVGSLWCQEMEQKIKENCLPDELPRIEVRQVVFSGTYDEQQWQVLKRRMDDNRAQLHGVIIPPSTKFGNSDTAALAAEINQMAPNFSPTRK